jgi:hypothetical protein
VGKLIIPPPFLALNLIKKLFYFSMEAYIVVSQGYKDIWIRVCFETIVTFFFIAAGRAVAPSCGTVALMVLGQFSDICGPQETGQGP